MDEHRSSGAGYGAPFARMTTSWTRAVGHLSKSVVEANRAAMAAFGGTTDGESAASATAATTSVTDPAVEEVLYGDEDWTFERSVDRREDLGVGATARFSKHLSDADVRAFARITGDTNRLHLDDEFARGTRFGGRIAHGTLVSGLISAALARLPGLTIYLSQDLEFRRPVSIGDRVEAVCEVVEDLGDDRYRLTTRVEDADGETVVDGEAIVLIDESPDGDDVTV
ncbi:MAG: MaoC family dehydratase [Halobacteriaceae archaeon]